VARFLIAAAHKSSGKTVVSTGLAAALSRAGNEVQCFKKGPDYIDPMWLAAASGRPCYNLDFNTLSAREILALSATRSRGARLAMIEANKGLFDGVDLRGSDSNAALARLLQAPVVLVIDSGGMTRGIAPLLRGYQAFDPEVRIAGVILNKVGGPRHEAKLRAAVETYTDIPVLGAIWRDPALDIGERHLGLTTPAETGGLEALISRLGARVRESLDLARLLTLADGAPPLPAPTPAPPAGAPPHSGLRIGIARDQAFGFYYPDDLEEFERLGARLLPIDTLRDRKLPEIDGLFIGGGFPETAAERLAANDALRREIRRAIEAGLPTYAECGGLMYLCRSLGWEGSSQPMCGVLPADALMCSRPQGRGYTRFRETENHPWGPLPRPQLAHEFHYARLDNLDPGTTFGREILRGYGIDGRHDAIVMKNLVAGFCHLRNSAATPWVGRFLAFVQACRDAAAPSSRQPGPPA